MTFEEYTIAIDKMTREIMETRYFTREELDELYDFQMNYMKGVLADYKKRITTTAQEYIYELFKGAVEQSTSGNRIIDVPSKEIAMEIDEIIWSEIGDYLLDIQIYEENNGQWIIDAIFGGCFIPGWDGWEEDD